MTLDQILRGQYANIMAIPNEQIRAQAIRFGISYGCKVRCIEKITGGPIVLTRGKQEIAIGRELAQRIQIELV
ncbi:FeoA family protein [Anaerosinus massiliensis]|uniref:FeoA family protein n=1 Tax=Massilibacillus massiliensis TaxID=1806837 RepID=UPI000DA63E8C|nr:ferrous iron transport protein A [Massilibacillus massiliensis]